MPNQDGIPEMANKELNSGENMGGLDLLAQNQLKMVRQVEKMDP